MNIVLWLRNYSNVRVTGAVGGQQDVLWVTRKMCWA